MNKIRKYKKKIFKIGTFSAASALMAVSVSSCAGILDFESSVQLVVSDAFSTLADQSFSQASYDGIRNYMESIGIDGMPEANSPLIRENNGIWKKPGTDVSTRANAYRRAFADGSKIVVATGFNQHETLQEITSRTPENKAIKKEFENKALVFVDGAMNWGTDPSTAGGYAAFDSDPRNISSISYRADDGSVLAGISTAVYLNLNHEYFLRNNKDKTAFGATAFVGLGFATTLNFVNGFRMGLHYWNEILMKNIKTVDGVQPTLPVKWVSPTKDNFGLQNFVTGSFAANEPRAVQISNDARMNGANVIFPVAGPQARLAISSITSNRSDGYANTFVLGVDTPQELDSSLNQPMPDAPPLNGVNGDTEMKVIPFSSTKNLAGSVSGVLNAINNGGNGKNGKEVNGYRGLGWNNVGSLNNAGVGVSNAGLKYLINPDSSTWKVNGNSAAGTDSTLIKLISEKSNVANSLDASDPVIKKYSELLNGTFKTGDNTGPKKDGIWTIKGGEENNYLSVHLSDLLPAIKDNGKDVVYFVPSSEPIYAAISSWDDANKIFSPNAMFFRKV